MVCLSGVGIDYGGNIHVIICIWLLFMLARFVKYLLSALACRIIVTLTVAFPMVCLLLS